MKVLLSLAITLAIPFAANAFKMTPIEIMVDSSGAGKTRTVKLVNNEKKEAPIQVSVYKRGVDKNGKETRTPTKDFIIFPKQLILKPGERRNLRLSWSGPQNIKSERAYRLHVQQIPVDIAKKNSDYKKAQVNLNIIFSYMGAIYVKPPKLKVAPKLVTTRLQRLKGNKVKITLENQGSEHAVLKNYDVIVSGKNLSGNKRFERSIDKQFIPEENLTVNMLAKTKRELIYKLPPKTITGDITLLFRKTKR